MDVSVRKANSQWCRTQSGMNMLSPVEASRSHVVARLGLVVAVGRNNGSTNVIPVSLFSVVKKDSKSRFDQSAPLANFLDDGMGLCGIWHILSHLSFDDADVSLSFIGASSCFEGNGGSLSWATRSSCYSLSFYGRLVTCVFGLGVTRCALDCRRGIGVVAISCGRCLVLVVIWRGLVMLFTVSLSTLLLLFSTLASCMCKVGVAVSVGAVLMLLLLLVSALRISLFLDLVVQ